MNLKIKNLWNERSDPFVRNRIRAYMANIKPNKKFVKLDDMPKLVVEFWDSRDDQFVWGVLNLYIKLMAADLAD